MFTFSLRSTPKTNLYLSSIALPLIRVSGREPVQCLPCLPAFRFSRRHEGFEYVRFPAEWRALKLETIAMTKGDSEYRVFTGMLQSKRFMRRVAIGADLNDVLNN